MGNNRDSTYVNSESTKKKKKKRKRTVISAEENEKLEQLYRENSMPDRLEKIEIAKLMGRPDMFVSVWFQNRRAREKKALKNLKRKSEGQLTQTQTIVKSAVDNHAEENPSINLGTDDNDESSEQDLLEAAAPHESTVSTVRSPLFGRIVRMAAAAETGILQTDSPYLGEALADACRGIDIADGKLVYHQVHGFSFQKY